MNIPLDEAIQYLENLKNNAKLGYGGEYFSGDFDDSQSALKNIHLLMKKVLLKLLKTMKML